ncbi:hypothetical protein SUGI_0684500 [Cryptomeria japonica]|nr:hypothetical protein SUGI_0684500 [Cryptomeria japonica]
MLNNMHDAQHITETVDGSTIKDYMEPSMDATGPRFKWKSFDMLNEGSREKLLQELGKRQIMLRNDKDEIIWCTMKSGEYSTRLGCLVSKIDREDCK